MYIQYIFLFSYLYQNIIIYIHLYTYMIYVHISALDLPTCRSVCSWLLMRTHLWPVKLARKRTKDVLPADVGPSSSTGSRPPLSSLAKFCRLRRTEVVITKSRCTESRSMCSGPSETPPLGGEIEWEAVRTWIPPEIGEVKRGLKSLLDLLDVLTRVLEPSLQL